MSTALTLVTAPAEAPFDRIHPRHLGPAPTVTELGTCSQCGDRHAFPREAHRQDLPEGARGFYTDEHTAAVELVTGFLVRKTASKNSDLARRVAESMARELVIDLLLSGFHLTG